MEINEPKRPGKNSKCREWDGDKVQVGQVFWDTKGDKIDLELGSPKVPFGLWKAI